MQGPVPARQAAKGRFQMAKRALGNLRSAGRNAPVRSFIRSRKKANFAAAQNFGIAEVMMASRHASISFHGFISFHVFRVV
jgi:hypothetical protein